MCDSSNSVRIDWFDGSVLENERPNPSPSNEQQSTPSTSQRSQERNINEMKAIGFRKLYEISQLEPPILNLELESRVGFWLLFTTDLSDDYYVLIIKTLNSLYKSLNRDHNSKLTRLLETKFMKSDFFTKLNNYITNLPAVKFSQKCRNSQLWDDVNKFFCDLADFYSVIFSFYKSRKEYLKELYELVMITETSALLVQKNHSETINTSFYNNIEILKTDINKELYNSTNEIKRDKSDVNQAMFAKVLSFKPNEIDLFYYKNLPVFPASIDFSNIDILDYITPNIINGAYTSIEHYLDLQFKLLREDCFRPLVEGIHQYMQNQTIENCKDIRVYRRALITDIEITNNRVGYVVDLSLSAKDLKMYQGAKTFMHGSLLLFTCDNLKNVLCATVLAGEKRQRIIVSFAHELPDDVFSSEFLMVESEVYFEPYHKVLKVLQNASTASLPMQKYIVYADKNIHPPSYLKADTTYSIKNCLDLDLNFEVLRPGWPTSKVFGLDDSQMDAFKFALTREFVVIQGPPGTGKTYLGTKIAGMLLQNVSFKQSPMLIICCTNHALDQFLEGLLKYTDSIVRLGGQSKSEILQEYNLNRIPHPKAFSRLYYAKKAQLNNVYERIKAVATDIEICRNSILSRETLVRHSIYPFLLDRFNDDPIVDWLFDDSTKVYSNRPLANTFLHDDVRISFSETMALKQIKTLKDTIALITSNADFPNRLETIDKCKKGIREYERKIAVFQEMFSKRYLQKVVIPQNKSLYEFNRDERWAFYFGAVRMVQNALTEKKKKLYAEYVEITNEIDYLRDTLDCEKLKDFKVVGMTTTMAAGRHTLLKMLKSFVVIVEEAAEVLETHIVAALTNECKHLMLIGDHQQLRPTSAHYIVGKKFNLEVSLFERMVRNGVLSKTLITQRRMRKEIMDLLVPNIYENLKCHPSVLLYPDIRGMHKNLYFFNHTIFEDTEEDSSSCKNKFEAEWCVSLANYFVKLNYEQSEITILTTYSAQVALITEMSKRYELLKDVHITTVDNFQGEENRIVILSLVRSNKEKNIGFLATANRVCVALSRAKEGLYIFGNMSCLETSPIWRTIKAKLEKHDAIGEQFRLIFQSENTEDDRKQELKVNSPDFLVQDGLTDKIIKILIIIYTFLNYLWIWFNDRFADTSEPDITPRAAPRQRPRTNRVRANTPTTRHQRVNNRGRYRMNTNRFSYDDLVE